MEERVEHDRSTAERHLLGAPVDTRDAERTAGEELGREAAEGRDNSRPDEFELPVEVGLAGGRLLGQRVAVARRPALEHRRQVDVVQPEADAAEQALEKIAGTPCERQSVAVLVEAGCLAHERELGLGVALAEDNLRSAGVQRAPDAPGGPRSHLAERRWKLGAHRRHCTARPGRPRRPRDVVDRRSAGLSGRSRSCRRSTRRRPSPR